MPLASHKFLLRMAQVLKSFQVVYKKCKLLSLLQLLTYLIGKKWGLGARERMGDKGEAT